MPVQNRVNPFGQFERESSRGLWLGNRGILHNQEREIVRPWKHKSWVTCRLNYKGKRREIFSDGGYSELFFLDEATAFSAGHRPCAECRNPRYKEFKAAWCASNPQYSEGKFTAVAVIDKYLHRERAIRGGGKVTYTHRLADLPPGTMVQIEGSPFLVWAGRLFPWTHYGYQQSESILNSPTDVAVLTPKSIVSCYRQGFKPQVHETANS